MKNLWNDFQDFLESLQSNGKSLLILSIGLIVLMGIITVGVFFLSVKGSEEVMVPDVVGKEFTTACLLSESVKNSSGIFISVKTSRSGRHLI